MNRIMRADHGRARDDYGCMLRAYRRDIVDAMLACGERSAYIPALGNSFAGNFAEIDGRACGAARGRVEVPACVAREPVLRSARRARRPRRSECLSIAGTVLAIAGVGFGVLLLAVRFVYGPAWAAQGVFTIFAVLFLFLGVQLLGMGLLGEYIGRISRDVQRRPRYLVRKVIGCGRAARRGQRPPPRAARRERRDDEPQARRSGSPCCSRISLLGLGRDLWTPDEPREAEIGREMLLAPSIVPTLNGEVLHREAAALLLDRRCRVRDRGRSVRRRARSVSAGPRSSRSRSCSLGPARVLGRRRPRRRARARDQRAVHDHVALGGDGFAPDAVHDHAAIAGLELVRGRGGGRRSSRSTAALASRCSRRG